MVDFEWDEDKNESNRRKHGIWFEEARQVFEDPNALMFFDKDHSTQENRFIMLGRSSQTRILVVVFSETESENILRVISARMATKKELKRYEEGI
jgi:hypothetical protein